MKFIILNWRKWILVVDIPPQGFLNVLLSFDHSSWWKFKVYKITHTKVKLQIDFSIGKTVKSKRRSKIWGKMSTTNIHLLQFKIMHLSRTRVICKCSHTSTTRKLSNTKLMDADSEFFMSKHGVEMNNKFYMNWLGNQFK